MLAGDEKCGLAAWADALPASGGFTHLTAASLYGWWLPPLPPTTPVFASQLDSDLRPRRRGLRVSRLASALELRQAEGLRVVAPVEVLLACARDLSLLDLLVLVDSALAQGDCTFAELISTARLRRRGAPRLRRALPLADGRSESAWETLLRVLHQVCGVVVEPQAELLLADGRNVRGDLWIVGTRTLHEYDGQVHLSVAAQRADLGRARSLANAGWTRRGYTAREVLFHGVTILRDADLSLGREHRPERARPWHAMLAESLFTPSGTRAFLRRVGTH